MLNTCKMLITHVILIYQVASMGSKARYQEPMTKLVACSEISAVPFPFLHPGNFKMVMKDDQHA